MNEKTLLNYIKIYSTLTKKTEKRIVYRIRRTGHNSITGKVTFILFCQPNIDSHNTITVIITLIPSCQ